MDDFTAPLLATTNSSYTTTAAGAMQLNHHLHQQQQHHTQQQQQQHHQQLQQHQHHHKDHMLAAGSTPTFLYNNNNNNNNTNNNNNINDNNNSNNNNNNNNNHNATTLNTITTTSGNSTKLEAHNNTNTTITTLSEKNDYTVFTNCIQQSTLLGGHRNVDATLDCISLSSLCDLKFVNNQNSLVVSGSGGGSDDDGNANVSPLQIDTNTSKSCVPSLNNLLFSSRETLAIDPNSIMNCHQTDHNTADTYITLKTDDVLATSFLQNSTVIKASALLANSQQQTTESDILVLGGGGGSDVVNNKNVNNVPETTTTTILSNDHNKIQQHTTQTSLINDGTLTNAGTVQNFLHASGNHSLNMNVLLRNNREIDQITHLTSIDGDVNRITTTTTTTTDASSTTNHLNTANNKTNQTTLISNNTNNNVPATTIITARMNSIEEQIVAGSSTANCSSNTSPISTALPVSTIVVNDCHSSSNSSVISGGLSCGGGNNSRSSSRNNSVVIGDEKDTLMRPLQSDSSLHQLHGRSSVSNLSSEYDDSMTSDEDFTDLDISERGGYQDNTSSHSHQSGNGSAGGGGGGGGGGGSNGNSNTASLLNGVGGIGGNGNGSGGGGGNQNNSGNSYMSLLPPTVGASSSSGHIGGINGSGVCGTSATVAVGGGPTEGIDFKHLFEELCPVCGDKVSGYHYGLLTCESCKGFFKRTVQNKKVYTCVAERSCHIDKTQRKRCPYCRFQKCLEVGMKLEAVRADRMRGGRNKFGPMYKRDRARKLQVMRQRQLALQALRTSMGTADIKPSSLSPAYQQAYPNMNIKQEIQIPQVSSLTQSPDSSPSPIAIALGQVSANNAGVITTPMNGGNGNGGGGSGGNGSNGGNGNNSNNTTSDGINRNGNGSCHEAGTGSLQNSAESKFCIDSGTHPSSTADSIIEPLRVSPMIREFVQSIDDREWQTQLFALLQKQTYNQVEVDLFELMCKVLDQNLFSQVDWARNTVFFKDLKVDDQMKLLQHSWSDMLVLDHLHQRIHNNLPDETQLNNGQVFNLLSLGLLGVPQLSEYFNELQKKLQELKFDMGDYVCMKFLILLNPDVRGIINKKTVLEGHENVQAALLDYTLTCYPSVTDKFRRLLNILPDIHAMAGRGEEHLYSKHCAGSAPTQTLLMEMLHAKRKA